MHGKIDYVHYVPDVPLNPDFDRGFTRILVEDLNQIKVPDGDYYMAWDTETSGLDASKDYIVGCSFTFDGKTAYYIPIKHRLGHNFGNDGLAFFNDIIHKSKLCLLYNCQFDFRFMEWSGFNMEGVPYSDVMINTWLADTNIPMPSLKGSVKKFLGWQMTLFEEVLGEEVNASFLDSKQIYSYVS